MYASVPLPRFKFEKLTKKEVNDFKRSFHQYLIANELNEKAEKQKVALLRLAFNAEVNDLIDNIEEQNQTVAGIWDHLEGQLVPKNNTCYEQYHFFNRKQGQEETFLQFYQDLKNISKYCEFGDQLETILKVRIVYGIKNNQLRERLLRNPTLTLKDVVDHCRAAEEAKERAEAVAQKEEQVVMAINHSQSKPFFQRSGGKQQFNPMPMQHYNKEPFQVNTYKQIQSRSYQPNRKFKSKPMFANQTFNCTRCTSRHSRGQCPAYGKICQICNGRNHYTSVCFKKKDQRRIQSMNCEDEGSDIEGGDVISGNTVGNLMYLATLLDPLEMEMEFEVSLLKCLV
ncbi:hypothetical protein M8J77_007308 [Diaphorina citri]|nr:hypothetical protein M8J77_007308 [Diaphorina citri]